MQQKDELSQQLPSNVVRERPLHNRVGVYIQARDTVDAITRIREAEHAGVQQVWMAMGGAGFADILTVLAVAATQTDRTHQTGNGDCAELSTSSAGDGTAGPRGA
jgi:hypothetical protein